MAAMQLKCDVELRGFLKEAAAGPPQTVASFLVALQARLPLEVAHFLSMATLNRNHAELYVLVADLRSSNCHGVAENLLDEIARNVPDAELLAFRDVLARHAQPHDADYLLRAAIAKRPVTFMSRLVSSTGNLSALWCSMQRTEWTQATLEVIAESRTNEDIDSFLNALKKHGLRFEARQLRKLSR